MSWIPFAAWLAGLVIALVVLGYCTYEVVWKIRRLRRNARQLRDVAKRLALLQGHLAVAQQRLTSTRVR